MRAKSKMLLCICVCFVMASVLAGCDSGGVGVRVKKAERKPLEAFAYANGMVEAEAVDEIYFDKGTRIDAVYVKAGDAVNEDQRLLQYNGDRIRNSIMDGVVTEVNVRRGMIFEGGRPALVIMDTSKLVIKADVKQSDSAGLQIGQLVNITGDALSAQSKLSGKIEEISQVATKVNNQSFVPVKIRMEGQIPEALKAGMTVNCDIRLSRRDNALTITYEAVKEVGEDKFVFVVKNGTLQERKVTLGASFGITVEVKEGLEEGDLVVLDPKPNFSNGMAASILSTEK